MRTAWLLALATVVAACAAPGDESDAVETSDGKGDRASGSRFDEVDPSHSTKAFRDYVNKALDALKKDNSELARLTLWSIEEGFVKIDELRDLTCADFEHVRNDLPDAHLTPADRALLHRANSRAARVIEEELDGYMWNNRVYVSRQMTTTRLAATLIHETNHVLNRSEIGYYDNLPTSAFIHEYRAFYAEAQFDTKEWAGTDIADYVIEQYDLDRDQIDPAVLAHPLTPMLLPDAAAWKKRNQRHPREAIPDICR